ncbi:hypothetical protein [Streptomyces galilaeus]|uniref:hypothetical protein n=1 Tax=Streptomyces galilaeus TaxID=33899 RepID=UPI00123E1414|nr:hypothetical protein [Streptomyces galilaeus]GGW83797.1 hypothetical protein GCM10010350_80750 [Streptomyces galilaeus]
MSERPQWWSEPVAATGSAKAEGIRKQLGRPRLDPLTVLVRESAQNSLDAADPDSSGVRYGVHLTQPEDEQLGRWQALLCPGPSAAALGVEELFSGRPVIITISDRGTKGLGGPLHADQALEPGADFVNLLRNIGEPPEQRFRGGTYGFGKGALFTTSSIGTILVRTRCRWQGRLQSRLIAASLSSKFQRNGRVYTGRHWWGHVVDDVPDPLLDAEADDLAARLGLPPMPSDGRGTDIAIVGAQLGSAMGGDEEERQRTVREAADYLASAMMWNLWPLMLPDSAGNFSLHCHVSADGVDVPVPNPDDEPSIRPFVDAYRALDQTPTMLRRKRPATVLGSYAVRAGIAPLHATQASLAAPFIGPSHHCARMRAPRLIVDYLPGPRLANDAVQYGAVFLADLDHDRVFADAEPPTHDAWVVNELSGNEASIVRRAEAEVRSALEIYVERQTDDVAGASTQPPLGALSSRLSALIPTASGLGADGRTAAPSTGGRGASAAWITQAPRMMSIDGDSRIVTRFQVRPNPGKVTIHVVVSVAIDVGTESEPPAGADVPTVLELRDAAGRVVPGDIVTVGPTDPRDWTVIVRPVSGAAARVRLVVHEDGGEP